MPLAHLRAVAQDFINSLDATQERAHILRATLDGSEFIADAAESVRTAADGPQFVGLRDRNDEKLYVGDRVEITDSSRFGVCEGVVRIHGDHEDPDRVPLSLDYRTSSNVIDLLETYGRESLVEQAATYTSSTGRVTKITNEKAEQPAFTREGPPMPADIEAFFAAMAGARGDDIPTLVFVAR